MLGKLAFLRTKTKCNSCGKCGATSNLENRIVWATFSCYYEFLIFKKVIFGDHVCPSLCDFVSAPEPDRFFNSIRETFAKGFPIFCYNEIRFIWDSKCTNLPQAGLLNRKEHQWDFSVQDTVPILQQTKLRNGPVWEMWTVRTGCVTTWYKFAEVCRIVRPNKLLSVHQFTITDLHFSKFLM
jgi:hypothetical protein